jgi:hypothetical protein
MKKIVIKKIVISTLVLSIFIVPKIGSAQQINWRSLNDNKPHIINANVGWEYGFVAGVGYGQKLKTKLPIVLNLTYSSPFGDKVFDDFKTRLGAQAEVLKMGSFSASVKAYSIFRRYQNELVRLVNFGSEFSTNVGYYKEKWYIAGEFGFDKAITTHIKNSEAMKRIYPGVQNGWYVPTAGNYFYGVASGYSIKSNDIYIKVGKEVSQGFTTTPTLPFYLQFGINKRF